MTTTSPPATRDPTAAAWTPEPVDGSGLSRAWRDAVVVTRRNLRHFLRKPRLLVFSTIQPVMFVLLFAYVFAGTVGQDLPEGLDYLSYLLPGIFVQSTMFRTTQTAVGLAEDLEKGVVDRFRSMPMARSAVLVGRTLADLVRGMVVIVLMVVVGYLIGFRFTEGPVAALGTGWRRSSVPRGRGGGPSVDAREALRVLGLRGPAAAEEVKRAYRQLVRELHPDTGGDVERFRTVQAAYDVLREGTDAVVGGSAPQARAASVERRWWDAPSAWHEAAVERDDVDLTTPVPDGRVVPASVERLARLVVSDDAPARLVSRAPGSRLHRFVALLDPDLLCTLEVVLAPDGRRQGHDVVLRLRAPGGRGRRTLANRSLPAGWVRSRGSDAVTAERRLRPSHDPADTAVRVARAAHELCEALDWPLEQWFLLRVGDHG